MPACVQALSQSVSPTRRPGPFQGPDLYGNRALVPTQHRYLLAKHLRWAKTLAADAAPAACRAAGVEVAEVAYLCVSQLVETVVAFALPRDAAPHLPPWTTRRLRPTYRTRVRPTPDGFCGGPLWSSPLEPYPKK